MIHKYKTVQNNEQRGKKGKITGVTERKSMIRCLISSELSKVKIQNTDQIYSKQYYI